MLHSVLPTSIIDHPELCMLLSKSKHEDFTSSLTLTKSLINDVIKKSIDRYYVVSKSSSTIMAPVDVVSGYVDVAKVELILTNILFFFAKQEYAGTIHLSITNKSIDNVRYISIRIPDPEGYYAFLDQNWNSPLKTKSIDLGNYFSLIIASSLIDCHAGIFEYEKDLSGFSFVVNLPEDHSFYGEQFDFIESAEQRLKDSSTLELIDKAIDVITQNISNSDFNIGILCRELGVSQTNLYRKLQDVIKVSPNQLIRQIRLSEAHKILKSRKYLVAEVAIMVGFRDTRYFSKLFKEAYGMYPAEYSKSYLVSLSNVLTN